MTSIQSWSRSALCAFATQFLGAPLLAAEDGPRAPEIGIVHAAGDEAWIDVPASLGDTWKATLAELAERGRIADADLSYVETNGQIALDSLWIAVVPGASLDSPITRVRMVVLVSAEEHEQHTAALVGAGALLGAIAQRLPAAPPVTPAPFSVAPPVDNVPTDEVAVETVRAEGELVDTYNTYNTYNTYTTYDDGPEPYYVSYAPAVVYVWKPWWWLGWCHNGWSFGWNSWGSCWNTGWGWGGGWNSYCQSWWNWPTYPHCPPSGGCDPWWWDCHDNNNLVATSTVNNLRLRNSLAQQPNLSFTRRGTLAGAKVSGASAVASADRGTGSGSRSRSNEHSQPDRSSHRSSSGLAAVDAFPPRQTPSTVRVSDGRDSGGHSRSSSRSHSIIVSDRSSSGTRAKPGSVTKLKGLSLPTKLGAIHDAASLSRSTGTTTNRGSSPGFSQTSSGQSGSPFTISNGRSSGGSGSQRSSASSGSASAASSGNASSSSHSSSRSSDSGSGRSSNPYTSQPVPASTTRVSRSPAPILPQAAPRVAAPSVRSSGGSHVSSGSHGSSAGHASTGGHSSGGGRSSGGGSASSGGGSASSGASGSSGGAASSGGGGGGGSGRSSGRGPR